MPAEITRSNPPAVREPTGYTHAIQISGDAPDTADVRLVQYGVVPVHGEVQPPGVAAVGERRVVTIADRGQVTLNTDSRLELRITDHTLQASLLKGEALFSMLHRSTRPFTLVADSLLLKDVGTVFDVKFQPRGGIAVAVAQGSVALSAVDTITRRPTAAAPLFVHAGQIATHQDNRLMLKPPDSDELLRQTTWTSGSLTFRGSTVAAIAAELDRYNRIQLVIEDPTLAQKQISATFVTNDPESFVTKLSTIFPSLTLITHREGDQIRIRIEGETTSN